jgi:hypothetical protein
MWAKIAHSKNFIAAVPARPEVDAGNNPHRQVDKAHILVRGCETIRCAGRFALLDGEAYSTFPRL